MTNPDSIFDKPTISINKYFGFLHLSALAEKGLPCAEIKQFTCIDQLPPDILLSVRTAVIKQNDMYLPNIIGATKDEIRKWLNSSVDLSKYTNSIFPYSFGLQKYKTDFEKEQNRFVRIKEIEELKFFYHPFFIDEIPGATGRIFLLEDHALIETMEPHGKIHYPIILEPMQQRIARTDVFDVKEFNVVSNYGYPTSILTENQIQEIVSYATRITNECCLSVKRQHIILEWSYCFKLAPKHKKESPQLLFWGLRAFPKNQVPKFWIRN